MIAIITARGGSKRIFKKNIKDFMGKPMLHYAVDACVTSGIFSDVMVSTDDLEIASVARECGALVPFLRSSQTSDDYASTASVLLEVVQEYEKRGHYYDTICCVYPCVPFLTGDTLKRAYDVFLQENADVLMPVAAYDSPVQRSLKIKEGLLYYAYPEYQGYRSQDLEACYYDCGMFYFIKVSSLKEHGAFAGAMIPYVMPADEVQDIDTQEDWEKAEFKFAWKKSRNHHEA